jgi:hypothetical protein
VIGQTFFEKVDGIEDFVVFGFSFLGGGFGEGVGSELWRGCG